MRGKKTIRLPYTSIDRLTHCTSLLSQFQSEQVRLFAEVSLWQMRLDVETQITFQFLPGNLFRGGARPKVVSDSVA
jgi:hypothetical protein